MSDEVVVDDLPIEAMVMQKDRMELWRYPNGFYIRGPRGIEDIEIKAWRTEDAKIEFLEAIDPASKTRKLPTYGRF